MPDARGLDTIVAVGLNDPGHFGEGWHERTRDGRAPIPYRACGRAGAITMRRGPGARRLHVLLSAPVGVGGKPVAGAITVGGERHELTVGSDAWVLRSFPLPAVPDGVLRVSFSCDQPVVPDRFLHNGDGRELGWYVSAVWQD